MGRTLWPYHHLGELIAIIVATPSSPAHAASKQLLLVVASDNVLSVEIAMKKIRYSCVFWDLQIDFLPIHTAIVPPSTHMEKCTVFAKFVIVVSIIGRKLHFVMTS